MEKSEEMKKEEEHKVKSTSDLIGVVISEERMSKQIPSGKTPNCMVYADEFQMEKIEDMITGGTAQKNEVPTTPQKEEIKDEDLICPCATCQKSGVLYTEPVMLNCLHCFSRPCILKHEVPDTKEIRCPLCKTTTKKGEELPDERIKVMAFKKARDTTDAKKKEQYNAISGVQKLKCMEETEEVCLKEKALALFQCRGTKQYRCSKCHEIHEQHCEFCSDKADMIKSLFIQEGKKCDECHNEEIKAFCLNPKCTKRKENAPNEQAEPFGLCSSCLSSHREEYNGI